MAKNTSYPIDDLFIKHLLEKLRVRLLKMRMHAEMDIYKLLMKRWREWIVIIIAPTSVFMYILLSALYNGRFPEICSHVFTGTITVMGVIIGIVPLISFSYIGWVEEQERKIAKVAKDWKDRSDELRKEFKNEDVELVIQVANLTLKSYYDLKMGVLKYTKEFTGISLSTFLLMIVLYIVFMGVPTFGVNISAFLTILVNIIALEIIVLGISLLLDIVLSPPLLDVVLSPSYVHWRILPSLKG